MSYQQEPQPQTGKWESQPESTYEQGYRPMQPQYYPPPQYYPAPAYPPPQPYYPQQPMQPSQYNQQQPMYYPQQMMMPPQIVINNNIAQNVSQNVAQTNVIQGRPQINAVWRILYFLFIGWWAGLYWAIFALVFVCSIIGTPLGIIMLSQLPAVLTLHRK